jgi:MoaA/NifB/PqqE/SkfB family radical SAM enzyme
MFRSVIRATARRPRPADICRGAASGFEGSWHDVATTARWVSPWLRRRSAESMIDIDIETELPWDETRQYEYSVVYFATDLAPKFSDDAKTGFRLYARSARQRVRIAIPGSVGEARWLVLRVDPYPACATGGYRVHSLKLVHPSDADLPATERAQMMALKRQVRAGVVESERSHASECGHLPESLNIELTARCNLTCGHCSSHGTPDLHRRNNQIPSMDPVMLQRLADEVFPALSGVTLVGRGEPLLADEATWAVLVDALGRYSVMLRMVTNGTLLRRRLTLDLMPYIDMVTVSIDGNSEETMSTNRGGVQLDQVLDGVRHFHELRRAAGLARRPKLGLSWTLKRNNIHELPGFIERMAEFEPDNFYSRHLLVFFEKDREQSLIGDPALTNRYLRPALAALRRLGIRSDCPPLMSEESQPAESAAGVRVAISAKPSSGSGDRDRCPFVHRTAVVNVNGNVPTCSVPFARRAGSIADVEHFADVWNGPVMTGVRAAIDTPHEWQQCRSCWYREARYASQREAAAHHELLDPDAVGDFTMPAWDFRRQRK